MPHVRVSGAVPARGPCPELGFRGRARFVFALEGSHDVKLDSSPVAAVPCGCAWLAGLRHCRLDSDAGIAFDAPMRITMIRLKSEVGDTFELERSDAMRPVTEFRATPPALPNGRYTVEWRGLSADGHAMKGRFSFEVAR